jgi:hypothetical protein
MLMFALSADQRIATGFTGAPVPCTTFSGAAT